jgi:alpha-beta hydrolase superfamily lysophospholipase
MITRNYKHLLLAFLACSCAPPEDAQQPSFAALRPDFPPEVRASLTAAGSQLDRVINLEYDVPVGPNRWIHVHESFTPRAWIRHPRRAVLLLAGTPTTGDFYNIPFAGYAGRELLAAQGYFAFAADPEGAGQSSYPENGFSATTDAQVAAITKVIDYIRHARLLPRVDVYGEAEGGWAATELCADGDRVRSCLLSSMLFRTGTDFFNAVFGSPEFRALILGAPAGYLTTTPDLYFNVISGSSPEVADWIQTHMPGRYAMGQIAEAVMHMPSYDPTHARVPGLIIRGEQDQNAPASDTADLAAAYGSATGAGPAEVVSIAGARMIPRIEPPPHNDQFWAAVLEFLGR